MKYLQIVSRGIGITLFLFILPFSCRKNDIPFDAIKPPKIVSSDSVDVVMNGPTPEFKTRIYIFDDETTDQIVSVTHRLIILKKGAVLRGGRQGGLAATLIQPGEIVAAGRTTKTPQGFNRKVTAVKESKDGSEIEIETEDASLEDIFKNASFTLKKSFEQSTSLNHTLSRSTGTDGNGLAAELKTTGSASVSYGIEIPIEVKEYSLKKVEAKIAVSPKVNLSITATGKLTTGEIEVPVLEKKFVVVAIVPVGAVPFPIVLTPKVTMATTGEAGLEASATFNAIDVNPKWELGAGYESGKGLYGIVSSDKTPNKSGTVEGKLKGYLQAGFKTTLSVSLYDLDYISVGDEAHLFARVEGECSSEGKGKADLTINGGATTSAFAKFDLFGYEGNKSSSDNFTFGQVELQQYTRGIF